MDTGDTAWVLTSTALVLFMTPGLAFFYGGMVRSKNVLGMLMQNFFAMGLIGRALGDRRVHAGLRGLRQRRVHRQLRLRRAEGRRPSPVVTLGADGGFARWRSRSRWSLFAAYQMTFAIITPALITGATADRMKFSAYALFIGLWLVLVYAPVAHWVFGGGWIADMGALDFAGGAVVHINAGVAALAVVLVLGKRKGWPQEPMPPHNLPFTLLGTGILWFGWFGFNAGSALAANGARRPGAHEHLPGRARPPCSAGWSSSGSRTATPRRSAPPPAPSPAWSPSRRAPASSAAWPRSSSASSPASSASWPSR